MEHDSTTNGKSTNIPTWYSGKNVFLTGGTGFLGLCLLEKLLRTIPDIGTIYLLMRPKRGKEISKRLEELKTNSVFEKLKESDDFEKAFGKLKAVAGDVGEPDLGLSTADRALLAENVNVIFHSAATLDFAETLKTTVDINLLGTRRCLQLAKDCRKLAVYVQVSSAYVNSWRLDAEEIIYPLTWADAEEVISTTERLTAEELELKTPEILGEHPNTYTITKHMAELEVQKCEAIFPCAIVRPSMITTAWKEPIPGWTMSKNGPQGFIMGASRGVLRRLPVGKELIYDYIPVDVVVNELIAAGLYAGVNEVKKVEVYHCTTSTTNPFKWMTVEDKINNMLHRYPLMSAVWYPHLKFLGSVSHFKLSAFFVHIIPAFFLDMLTYVCGGRPILMKLHRNVNSSLNRLEKFIFTEWKFHNTRTTELQKWLSPVDQRNFNIDITHLHWPEYFEDLAKGVRQHLSKESLKNVEAARGKDTLLMVVHLAFQAAFYFVLWYLTACLFGTSLTKSAMIVPLLYALFSFL